MKYACTFLEKKPRVDRFGNVSCSFGTNCLNLSTTGALPGFGKGGGGGGFFERVRKVQTTFTRIFIVLESVSHDLSDEISRKAQKFKVFSVQNQVFSKKKKKKKKVFTEIEMDFSAKIGNSNVFSAQNQVVSKKKIGLHQNWDWFFGQIWKF